MKKAVVVVIISGSLIGVTFLGHILMNKLGKSVDTYNLLEEDINRVKIIAHRGGIAYSPENTLPAYETAGKLGFWGAECDTMATKDGHWILMHDIKVERTTNGKGKVSDLTLEEIKKLNVDTGLNISSYPELKVPTLEEYIDVCKMYNMVPIIEIKESLKNNYSRFLEILNSEGVIDDCIVISFSQKELMNIAVLNDSVKLQLIIDHPISKKDINIVKSIGNCDLNTKEPTEEGIKMAQDNGILVNCYLINSIDRAREVIHMKVNYFTTDWINRIN